MEEDPEARGEKQRDAYQHGRSAPEPERGARVEKYRAGEEERGERDDQGRAAGVEDPADHERRDRRPGDHCPGSPGPPFQEGQLEGQVENPEVQMELPGPEFRIRRIEGMNGDQMEGAELSVSSAASLVCFASTMAFALT